MIKQIIVVVVMIPTFIGGFILDGMLINWVVSLFENPQSDLAIVVKIGLWIITIPITFAISFFISLVVGAITVKYVD